MIRNLQRIALIILLTFGFRLVAQQRPAADVILTNAKIWTVDPERPRAEAVAIIGDRIVAVGSAAEIDRWRGSATKIIDGGGKLVLPGFNDAHVHFSDGGHQLDSVDLRDATSQQEFKKRIAERAQHFPKEWMTGGNWDDQKWTPAKLPTRQLIDSVTPNTPVFVSRYDGHMALANSVALKIADITKTTKAPPGGEIVRDANGEPTGVLKDAAMDLVYSKIPPPTRAELTRIIRRAMAHASRLGLTSVQDMAVPYEDVSVFSELAEKNELTTRIYVAPLIANWQDQAKIGIRHAFGTSYLRMGALKGFADGSLGSSTAYFFKPYADDPKNRGLLAEDMIPLSKMRDRLIGLDAAGLQSCIHAIGDEAISDVLDLYQDVVNKNGPKDRRFRIEHAQHMAPKDFDRFRQLDVIASVQPYHAIDDGRWAEKRIGAERAKATYAFRTFLDNKVRLAFGTDWPVAPLNPLLTIYAAVTRETLDGKNPDGWYPEQKLKVSEAVEAYTMGSAYAEFQDKEKGSITPGKLADMVMLSDDIFAIKPDAIKDVTVQMTMVGGKVVYPMKEQ
ncbi:MAG: amidohydrolase [Terriglobia bacterium]|jgi:predicted amidohydrolase YtcJ|nr:amidohydrolase [Terriglobia bacterium]